MKRRIAMKTMLGGAVAKESSSPADSPSVRVSWETGQSRFRHTNVNLDTYLYGGCCWVMLRLRDVDIETPFPYITGLPNMIIQGKIVSQVIFHKLNTTAEREHAHNHLYGLRLRLKLTKEEAKSYDVMLDCIAGRSGLTTLKEPVMVNSWGDPTKPWDKPRKS